ncbi:MAG: PAS domain-containing protein [Planctomycetes bacterium]|nr:PAS domain-containing protein [Planctomycetota bacterium]
MSRDSILITDSTGRIVWANKLAHDIVGLPAGGLLGRNYLEFTPPDTHADLLKLHKKKLQGESVRFRIDLGNGRVLTTTSGPVRIGDRLYLFAVGRSAKGKPAGDEILVGLLAAGEILKEKRSRVDVNSLLLGVLKQEAKVLRGKVSLDPGNPPDVLVRPWPVRMLLRDLLLRAAAQEGRTRVATGGRGTQAWVKVALVQSIAARGAELSVWRRIARDQGGRLQLRGRTVTLTLPTAGKASPSGNASTSQNTKTQRHQEYFS